MQVQKEQRVVIIGSGPTGLGAAYRLQELGHENFLVLEQFNKPGGLAQSMVDEHGFLWDMGGHVIFSHYEYFDLLLDDLLGKNWCQHIRESWVWMRDRFIAYPLQQNIWRLPQTDLVKCLDGLVDIYQNPITAKPTTFKEWILQKFGPGIADVFMFPYNYKVWGYHTDKMDCQWMGERVAVVNLKKVLSNLVNQKDDVSWGPNATFRYPLHGATGSIWEALYKRLPQNKIKLNTTVTSIDPRAKQIYLKSGEVITYDRLLSTMPLDCLLMMLKDQEPLKAKAKGFVHSSTHVVGIGLDGNPPSTLKTKCWLYFPEQNCPFYRVTVFSNYSPNNVPHPGKEWSLMCEITESPDKPLRQETLIAETIQGLKNTQLISETDKIISTFHHRLEYGYPTPFIGRDTLLNDVQKSLMELHIWSRGRFGGWKYEVANQDHSLMQGVEAIDNIMLGTEETTYKYPDVVNPQKAIGRRPVMLNKN